MSDLVYVIDLENIVLPRWRGAFKIKFLNSMNRKRHFIVTEMTWSAGSLLGKSETFQTLVPREMIRIEIEAFQNMPTT